MARDEYPCDICQRAFRTFAGLRQHVRLAHPVAYNSALAPMATNARRMWTVDEQRELAKLEAELNTDDVTAIIDYLAANSTRSRDAIKKRRHLQSYKDEVAQCRNTIFDNAVVQSPEADQLPEQAETGSEITESFREAISVLELTSDDDEHLRRLVLDLSKPI